MLSSSHRFCIKQKEAILLILANHLFLFILLALKAYSSIVVEPNGVEPLTSCVQGRRSTN